MLRVLLLGRGVPARDVERMVDGDLKETPSPHLGGRTPRLAMQILGTESGRALVPDLWVAAWAASIAGLERVVADDVRFENEVAAVRALGGTAVEVRRPGIVRPASAHASETGVAADAVMLNHAGPADLAASLDRAWSVSAGV